MDIISDFFSCMYTQIYNSILRPAPSRRLGRQNSVPYREQSYDSGRWFRMLPFPRNLISGQTEPSQAGTWPEHLLWSIVLYAPPPHDSDSLFWPLLVSRGLSSILQGQGLIAPCSERALLPLQGGGGEDGAWDSEVHRGIRCEGQNSPPSSYWQPSPCPPTCFCPALCTIPFGGNCAKKRQIWLKDKKRHQ